MANNPPAFPNHPGIQIDTADPSNWHGMTLRDWFAGQAFAGDLASQSPGEWGNNTGEAFMLSRAAFYYRFADAMLAQREKSS